jgi:signal transduction histidine kinase
VDSRDLLVALALGAGWVTLFWLRTGHGTAPRPRRSRLATIGWCAAFQAIDLAVTGAFERGGRHYPAIVALGLVTAIVMALAPELASRLVPVALVGLGLYGLVAARVYGFWTDLTASCFLLPAGRYQAQYYLVLPVAYGLLALGGWLLWRGTDPGSAAARLVLGRLATPPAPGQRWALLLIPVSVMSAALFIPGLWFASGAIAPAWIVALVCGTLLVIRRYPGFAAALATAGLAGIGAAGLEFMTAWPDWPGPRVLSFQVIGGVVSAASRPVAELLPVEALAFIAVSAWLAPRAIPRLGQLLGLGPDADLVQQVRRLTESRADAVDTAASELRRLERDLHDGAQARLVALGMHLRAAERLIPTSPDAALALVAEARESSARALTELRELVRGAHPPVLADRGLGAAISALALDTPMRVETDVQLPGRLPAPIETACYFAVAELLTNAVKHAGATQARISLAHADGTLRVVVTDFGTGGADPSRGSGLAGIEKRLAAFDGILAIISPVGGPTMCVLEVPCALSSQKTSSC